MRGNGRGRRGRGGEERVAEGRECKGMIGVQW